MTETLKPYIRVLILITSTVALGVIYYFTTGELIPSDTKDIIVFQNALFLIILGSSIIEYKFTKPADALVEFDNGLTIISAIKKFSSNKVTFLDFVFTVPIGFYIFSYMYCHK